MAADSKGARRRRAVSQFAFASVGRRPPGAKFCLCFQSGECVTDLADFPAESMNAPQDKLPAPQPSPSTEPLPEPPQQARPKEIGGRDGPEPTRFGDWEKAGRCIDF
jgi:hypothetical protein